MRRAPLFLCFFAFIPLAAAFLFFAFSSPLIEYLERKQAQALPPYTVLSTSKLWQPRNKSPEPLRVQPLNHSPLPYPSCSTVFYPLVCLLRAPPPPHFSFIYSTDHYWSGGRQHRLLSFWIYYWLNINKLACQEAQLQLIIIKPPPLDLVTHRFVPYLKHSIAQLSCDKPTCLTSDNHITYDYPSLLMFTAVPDNSRIPVIASRLDS